MKRFLAALLVLAAPLVVACTVGKSQPTPKTAATGKPSDVPKVVSPEKITMVPLHVQRAIRAGAGSVNAQFFAALSLAEHRGRWWHEGDKSQEMNTGSFGAYNLRDMNYQALGCQKLGAEGTSYRVDTICAVRFMQLAHKRLHSAVHSCRTAAFSVFTRTAPEGDASHPISCSLAGLLLVWYDGVGVLNMHWTPDSTTVWWIKLVLSYYRRIHSLGLMPM